MNEREINMGPLSLQIGLWSAAAAAAAFLIFSACFVAILLINPPFVWTNLAEYAEAAGTSNQTFKYVAQTAMLLFGPLLVLMLSSIYDYAAGEKKILVRISVAFGLAFAVLIGLNYFVELSIVRHNLARGQLEGLEHFVQANPASVLTAINMLGWTLFLGLASLFVAPIFSGGRLEKVIKVSFLLNGLFCLLGGIGYVFEKAMLVFLTMNLGMGGAVVSATIALTVLFRRMLLQGGKQ